MVETYALYDSLLSPVVIVDQGLAVVYFNQSFAQFFQLPPRKIRAKAIDDVLVCEAQKLSASVAACLASKAETVTPELAVTGGAEKKEVVLKFIPVDQHVIITMQDFSIERTLHAKHRVQLDEIKKYSEGLEVLVNQRTHELKTEKEQTESILRSIREGIFVVEKNQTIGAQCSGSAMALLGKDHLQGEKVGDVLFPRLDVSGMKGEKAKICDFLVMAFNLFIPDQFDDLTRFLPKSIRFPKDADTLAVYGLSFSPVVDDGSILRIVVAVRDDTELEELRNAAVAVHKRVIEALASSAATLGGPARTAYVGFLKEAATLLGEVRGSLSDIDRADIDGLFRALHTIKGGSRHYKLAFLQHFAHTAETLLDKLRKDRASVPANERRTLEVDVGTLAVGVQALATLCGAADAVKTAESSPVDAWQGFVQGLEDGAAQLAGELGKAATLRVHASHALMGKDLTLLGGVAQHLLRNALDHGLEETAARKAKGKSESGRLELTIDCVNGWFFGRFEDDGGGIDCAAVTRLGIARGLLPAASTELKANETLKVLAAPGFSTREAATEVSGRGVGLDAVWTALKANGGHLAIERSDARGTSFIFSWRKQEEGLVPLDAVSAAA